MEKIEMNIENFRLRDSGIHRKPITFYQTHSNIFESYPSYEDQDKLDEIGRAHV